MKSTRSHWKEIEEVSKASWICVVCGNRYLRNHVTFISSEDSSDVRCAPRISGHTIDVASSKGNSESLKSFSCIAMCYDILLPMNIQFGTITSWDKSVLCAHESWFLGCLWRLHVKGCVLHISTCFPQLHQPNLPVSYELGQSDPPHRADLSSSVLQAHQEWALKASD